MMLICNEGKEDKKYHIAYQLNIASPVIPYCRSVGHLDVLIQVQSDNPKICEKCRKVAGIPILTSVKNEAFTEASKALTPTVVPMASIAVGREKLRPHIEELFSINEELIKCCEPDGVVLRELQQRLSNVTETLENVCGFDYDPATGKVS